MTHFSTLNKKNDEHCNIFIKFSAVGLKEKHDIENIR